MLVLSLSIWILELGFWIFFTVRAVIINFQLGKVGAKIGKLLLEMQLKIVESSMLSLFGHKSQQLYVF